MKDLIMGPTDHDSTIDEKEESFANYSMTTVPSIVSESQAILPFDLLPGEISKSVGTISDGVIGLTNYRLGIQIKDSIAIVPLAVIETLENREGYLSISCKDAKTYRWKFPVSEDIGKWMEKIQFEVNASHNDKDNVFAYVFRKACEAENTSPFPALNKELESYEQIFDSEVKRLGFDLNAVWRVTTLNEDYGLCSSYPRKLIVPSNISDCSLDKISKYRHSKRIPTAIWRHVNGAVIARCSQPEVGWLGWRSSEDESIVQAISEACAIDDSYHMNTKRTRTISDCTTGPLCDLSELAGKNVKKCLIVDARSYSVAFANRARGGGVECQEYYQGSEVQFMNLPNIHVIKKSHSLLRQLLTYGDSSNNASWLTTLDYSKWLSHISGLIKSGVHIAKVVSSEARPVLVHCSDGWDRTPQITSLAQLLMDPYYRTITGFRVLVEKDWIEFGHKFRDRCGTGISTGMSSESMNERSPIFLQWLECVQQITVQFPTAFEFNESFLVKLAQHTYSNLFGNFLCNSSQERMESGVFEETFSVWSLFKVLYPSILPQDLNMWKGFYDMERNVFTEDSANQINSVANELDDEPLSLPKTKSCDNLVFGSHEELRPISMHLRRSSDPNLCKSTPVASSPSKHVDPISLVANFVNCGSVRPAEIDDGYMVPDAEDSTLSFEAKDLPLSVSQELALSINLPTAVEEKQSSYRRRTNSRKSLEDTDQLDTSKSKCQCSNPVEVAVDAVRLIPRVKSSNSSGPRFSNPPSPGHSRSSSSGVPSTPADERFVVQCEKNCGITVVDGLRTPNENEATKRIQQMIIDYQIEVENLRKSLQYTKDCHQQLLRNHLQHDDGRPRDIDQLSLPDSLSVGSAGSNAEGEYGSSEPIWDLLEREEAQQTLWVPDFAADRCEGCQGQFWIGRRRHHCRSCGKIFCASCSNKTSPVPKENLLAPVRVCSECFQLITSQTDL